MAVCVSRDGRKGRVEARPVSLTSVAQLTYFGIVVFLQLSRTVYISC
jgi:hypothetical protein